MAHLTRRTFLAASSAAVGAASAGEVASAVIRRVDGGVPDLFPTQEADAVREVVGASHTDIEAVREAVTRRPSLAKASWDWGFGDWESALGAASHMGRPDIAGLLMAHGARPNLFTFAMLGQVDDVRAVCEANPGIQRSVGPHGTFTLMRHARMRGEGASDVIAYLEELGDADIPQPDLGMDEEAAGFYTGEYVPEGAPGVVFRIAYRPDWGVLTFGRDDRAVRSLFSRGGHVFNPAGAEAVRVVFDGDGERASSLEIIDGGLRLAARRAS
jgi:hypothetical protein